MHINFDDDGIEVKPTIDPKKKVDTSKHEEKEEESLEFKISENKEEKTLSFDNLDESPKDEPKSEVKDDFFGTTKESETIKSNDSFFDEPSKEESKSEVKDDFFGSEDSKKENFEIREPYKKVEEKIDKSGVMEIDLKEMSGKIDEVKSVAQGVRDDLKALKEVDKGVVEGINSEFEKIKGQIKSQSEEIKINLDEVNSNLERSREDLKLNLSKIKVSNEVQEEKEEGGKKSLLNKKASTDSLFRVIFFMIFITLATVIYFGITIMDDLNKKSAMKSAPAPVMPKSISAKVDTTKFENEAKAIKGEILNLTKSLGEFRILLNDIKNQKVMTGIVQTPTVVPMPTPIQTTTTKEVIREVKFDDSSINEKLNTLSSEFEKISNKLNQINSKLSKVTNEVSNSKNELSNKMDRVEKNLESKIEAKTPKPIKIYSDGLQIRDE